MEEIDFDLEIEKEYKKLRETNINEAFNDLSDKEKKEFKEFKEKLSKIEKNKKDIKGISDSNLKKRIAKFALNLVNKTPKDEIAIRETTHILTNLSSHNFGDKLDEIFKLIGELELPEEYLSANVFDLWKKLKQKLENYLKK